MACPAVRGAYYNPYQIPQTYGYPILTEWSPIVTAVPAIYTSPIQPLPVAILTPPVITPVCPYAGIIVTTEPILVPQNTVPEITAPNLYCDTYESELNYVEEIPNEALNQASNQIDYIEYPEESIQNVNEMTINERSKPNTLEFYLSLPKELFPSARMFPIDPNQMIDEFCKISNVNETVPWILDLEFGVPRVPVTRAIAVYDVKFNSINCKNTPSAIHPGFEKCNDMLKKVILFYYDCIVSTWYKGFIILNYDKSVENFQSWLLIPMQVFGMCWP